MKFVWVIFVLTAFCTAIPNNAPIIFEPLFFQVVPGIGQEITSIKGINKNIPILIPKSRRTSGLGKSLRHGIAFPTAGSAATTVDNTGPLIPHPVRNTASGLPHIINMPGINPVPSGAAGSGGFVISFTTKRPFLDNPDLVTPFINNAPDDCPIKQSVIMYKGKCSRILSPLSCSEPNHWLVVQETGPKCVPQPCSTGQLLHRGRCFDIENEFVCGLNEILYVEHSGETNCDCQPYFVFDSQLGKCQEEHTQGSCLRGMYLESDPDHGVRCVHNPCPSVGSLLNHKNGQCYAKQFIGVCKTTATLVLQYNDKDGTVNCVDVHTRNIFEVPALTSCPSGSRRDYLGRCQRVLRFGPTSPFSYRVPSIYTSRYSACPRGYTKYPNGTCKKINEILG